jgi:DNA-binding response OmpR family regulator
MTGLEGRRVLVVEDEPWIAILLADALEAVGSEAVLAGTLAQALARATVDELDGAILDVHLPDGHVGPVIEALAARDVPFVIHSGGPRPDELLTVVDGARAFEKPAATDAILRGLAAEIASRGRRAQAVTR